MVQEPWCQLETLYLGHNSIGDPGIVAFARAISTRGNTMRVLHLYGSDVDMGEAGGSAML